MYKLKIKPNLHIKPLYFMSYSFDTNLMASPIAQLLSVFFPPMSQLSLQTKNTVNMSFRFKRLKIFGPVSKVLSKLLKKPFGILLQTPLPSLFKHD